MELLVFNKCNMLLKLSNLKDMTGWDIAISRGHVEVFDTLCHLAKAKQGSTAMHPQLNQEFQQQRFRRAECEKNRSALEYGNRPTEVASAHAITNF